MLIENKYAAIAAVIGFLLALWLSGGSLTAAFGVLALIAGVGWAVRRIRKLAAASRDSPLGRSLQMQPNFKHRQLVVTRPVPGIAH